MVHVVFELDQEGCERPLRQSLDHIFLLIEVKRCFSVAEQANLDSLVRVFFNDSELFLAPHHVSILAVVASSTLLKFPLFCEGSGEQFEAWSIFPASCCLPYLSLLLVLNWLVFCQVGHLLDKSAYEADVCGRYRIGLPFPILLFVASANLNTKTMLKSS